MNHHESDLPPEMIDETDLELKVLLKPIEFIFQAAPIEGLSKFMKVKKISDQTKLQAEETFNGLSE